MKKKKKTKTKNRKLVKNISISKEVFDWYQKKGEGSLSKGIDFVARRFMGN